MPPSTNPLTPIACLPLLAPLPLFSTRRREWIGLEAKDPEEGKLKAKWKRKLKEGERED
jgi:hypothetical protein